MKNAPFLERNKDGCARDTATPPQSDFPWMGESEHGSAAVALAALLPYPAFPDVGQWLCAPPFRYGLPFSGVYPHILSADMKLSLIAWDFSP